MDDQGFSNEELLNSVLDDGEPEVTTESEPQGDTRARDDQGRFVEKTEEAAKPNPDAPQDAKPVEQKETAQESLGVRQLREALERANHRTSLLEQQLNAQKPQPAPQPRPDLFEKPDEFVRNNVQEALNPLEQRLSSAIETMSRNFAISQHGEERLSSAYSALDQAAKTGDPQALAVVQAVKQSADPYGDIARWYQKQEASLNPQAFFQRQLEEALKDEKFKGELLSKLQPSQDKPQGQAAPVFNIPPKLSRAASSAASLEASGDFSNESLLASALR